MNHIPDPDERNPDFDNPKLFEEEQILRPSDHNHVKGTYTYVNSETHALIKKE